MEVNKNNIEEQILLYVDGELNTAEASALLQYIALHPEWHSLLDEYKSLVIPQDDDLVFEGKEALLQPEPQVIAFKKESSLGWMRWAAAVVLIAGAAGLTWQLSRDDKGQALPGTSGIAMQQQPKATLAADTVTPAPQLAQVKTVTAVKPVAPVLQPAKAPVHAVPQAQQPEVQLAKNEAVQIAPIAGSSPTLVAVQETQQPALELQRADVLVAEAPEQAVAINTEKLPSWLPVNEEKLEGVNDLLAHIREVKNKVAEKANVLRKSTFVIRLGGREIGFGK